MCIVKQYVRTYVLLGCGARWIEELNLTGSSTGTGGHRACQLSLKLNRSHYHHYHHPPSPPTRALVKPFLGADSLVTFAYTFHYSLDLESNLLAVTTCSSLSLCAFVYIIKVRSYREKVGCEGVRVGGYLLGCNSWLPLISGFTPNPWVPPICFPHFDNCHGVDLWHSGQLSS